MAIMTGQQPKQATAVPSPATSSRPNGSVLFTCAGKSEFGDICGALIFVWILPATRLMADCGTLEWKCRRCKTFNLISLSTDLD